MSRNVTEIFRHPLTGCHYCHFYKTRKDLEDVWLAFVKGAVKRHQKCICLASAPLGKRTLQSSLSAAMENAGELLDSGQLCVLSSDDWHVRGGLFNRQKVLSACLDALSQALADGYSALRIASNMAGAGSRNWPDLMQYEADLNRALPGHNLGVLCSYPVKKGDASRAVDAACRHHGAVVRRQGAWRVIENTGAAPGSEGAAGVEASLWTLLPQLAVSRALGPGSRTESIIWSEPCEFWEGARITERVRIRTLFRAGGLSRLRQHYPLFTDLAVIDILKPCKFRLHRHTVHEILLITRGSLVTVLNGETVTVNAGEGIILKPGDAHEDTYNPPVQCLETLVEFDPRWHGSRTPRLLDPHTRPLDQRFKLKPEDFALVVWRLLEESQASGPLAYASQDTMIARLLWSILRSLPERILAPELTEASPEDAFIKRLLRIFHEHMSEKMKLPEMARLMNVSPSTLSRLCRKSLGRPPVQAFTRWKLEHAAVVLRTTSKEVKQIAYDLGFCDPYHFSRAFRRVMGSCPSRYRRESFS